MTQTTIERWRAAKQINALNGWIKIDATTDDTYLMQSQTMIPDQDMELVEQEIELRYDDMVDLRAMLWDAMRRQGRGFEFSVDDVLKIEEVRHKGRYSVDGYAEEIKWTIALLKRHLNRINCWKGAPAEHRDAYGKLNEFLSQLEAPPGEDEDIAILQCQMCGCTLDGTGLDQQKEYVCEDCRARNPTHLPDLQTAQIA